MHLVAGVLLGVWPALAARLLAPVFGQTVAIQAGIAILVGLGLVLAPRLGRWALFAPFFSAALAGWSQQLLPLLRVEWLALAVFIPVFAASSVHANRLSALVAGATYGVATWWLIPAVGARWATIGATVLLIASLRKPWAAAALALAWHPAPPSPPLHDSDSPYQRVIVRQFAGTRYLMLDRDDFVHTVTPEVGRTHLYYDAMVDAAAEIAAKRILVLGLGAGEVARQLARAVPGASIDGVEIDPGVIEAARRFFALDAIPGLRVHVTDARVFLQAAEPATYDAILVDLFLGGPYVPWHCDEPAFYQALRRATAPGGRVIFNLVGGDADARIHAVFDIWRVRALGPNRVGIATLPNSG